jgi:uncharacterized protein
MYYFNSGIYYLCCMSIVEANIEPITDLCRRHKVNRLFVFCSVFTDRFKKTSDIDFIIDFSGVDLFDYADNYFDLKSSLVNLLKRDVDLLEEQAISNPYFRQSID